MGRRPAPSMRWPVTVMPLLDELASASWHSNSGTAQQSNTSSERSCHELGCEVAEQGRLRNEGWALTEEDGGVGSVFNGVEVLSVVDVQRTLGLVLQRTTAHTTTEFGEMLLRSSEAAGKQAAGGRWMATYVLHDNQQLVGSACQANGRHDQGECDDGRGTEARPHPAARWWSAQGRAWAQCGRRARAPEREQSGRHSHNE